MKTRYEKLAFETESGKVVFKAAPQKGQIFEISQGKEGELIIKTIKQDTENYTKPPIPEGYRYVEGKWNDGFVIERCSDGSQFVWVPVGSLDFDGNSPVSPFPEKFGRRNYQKEKFSVGDEPLTASLDKQVKSVEKYGGFYISRYNISKNADGKPQSVGGAMPWVGINFESAITIATEFEETSKDVCSHLPFGSEYDSVLAWFIKSGARSLEEIAVDSNGWGNYYKPTKREVEIYETGSNEEWCTNRIYDFAGNVKEFTFELEDFSGCRVYRGGSSHNTAGIDSTVSSRHICNDPYYAYKSVGFRVALYIK